MVYKENGSDVYYLTKNQEICREIIIKDGMINIDFYYGKDNVIDEMILFYDNDEIQMIKNRAGKNSYTIKEFYRNGQLRSDYKITDGKKEGEYSYYDKDGGLIKKCEYKDDKVVVGGEKPTKPTKITKVKDEIETWMEDYF